MGAWIVPPVAGFIDNGMAPEFYVDDIGGIEAFNGNIRVYLIAEHQPVEAGNAPNRLVTAKIIGPVLKVPRIIGQLAMCLWQPPKEVPVRGTSPHLVP